MRRPIEREPLSTLRASMNRRHEDEADVVAADYVNPDGAGGDHNVSPPGKPGVVYPVGGPKKTFAPGSRVLLAALKGSDKRTIISEPPPGRRGGSVVGSDQATPETIDAVKAVSADPAVWLPGSQSVEFTGYGFVEEPLDVLTVALWNATTRDYADDPYAAISGLAWVDATHVTATVTVEADTPLGYTFSVLARRGSGT